MSQPSSHPAARSAAQITSIGMYLFLAALAMLFASSMLGYVLIRFSQSSSASRGQIHLPPALYFSTLLIVASSLAIHRAFQSARQEHQRPLRRYLLLTLLLAIAFISVQAPALYTLLKEHQALESQGLHIYGLIFFLIFLHALHVAGGLIALVIITINAHRGLYDHESHSPLRNTALYWHFLDLVWLAMFTTLLLTR